ncbi:hypothetical protein Taro_055868 [Colocasia esculenta]|uniref:NAC domain-containing protein n=1 Tax=Colocasia esculenta TaxID=4460 RepID=A0A843XUW2_COLES|nr:hypothetical protein [Colocasia esculenta]
MDMVTIALESTGAEVVVMGESEQEQVIMPGFRFHPTDQELVGFYLRRKVEKKPIRIDVIKQVDIYKFDPWDLPRTVCNEEDKDCYFFCLRGKKYRNSIRPNRVTLSGFWKATGIDRPIYSAAAAGECNELIGLKKCLVYYRGSAGKSTKTDWMMHEFRLPPSSCVAAGIKNQVALQAETWTICRVFKRATNPAKRCVPSRQVDANPNTSRVIKSERLFANTCSRITTSDRPTFTYVEDGNQPYAGQCKPSAQAPPVLAHSSNIRTTTNPVSEFVLDEGSWDELGKVVAKKLSIYYDYW